MGKASAGRLTQELPQQILLLRSQGPCSVLLPRPFTAGTLPGLEGVGVFVGVVFFFWRKVTAGSEGLVCTAITLLCKDIAPVRDTRRRYNQAREDCFYSGGNGETEAAHIPCD